MEKGEDAVSLLGMGQRQGGGWHLRKSSCHLLSLSPVSSVLVASGLLLTKRVGKGMAAKRWREGAALCLGTEAPSRAGDTRQLARVSRLLVNETGSAFVLNPPVRERAQQDEPSWEPQFG